MTHFCEGLLISQANNGLYCKLSGNGSYCVYNPGSEFSAFECPKGWDGYPKYEYQRDEIEFDDDDTEQGILDFWEDDEGAHP